MPNRGLHARIRQPSPRCWPRRPRSPNRADARRCPIPTTRATPSPSAPAPPIIPDYEGSDDYRDHPRRRRSAAGSAGSTSSPARPISTSISSGAATARWSSTSARSSAPGSTAPARSRTISSTLLPERNTAFEVGGFAGITYHGLTNPYDALSFRVDVVKDVGDAHESTIVTPTIDFGTPLSRTHLCRRFGQRGMGRRRLCRLLLFDHAGGCAGQRACPLSTPTAASSTGGSACSPTSRSPAT